jgi:hypothetical protein
VIGCSNTVRTYLIITMVLEQIIRLDHLFVTSSLWSLPTTSFVLHDEFIMSYCHGCLALRTLNPNILVGSWLACIIYGWLGADTAAS